MLHGIEFGLDCFIQHDSSVLDYGILTVGTYVGLNLLSCFLFYLVMSIWLCYIDDAVASPFSVMPLAWMN